MSNIIKSKVLLGATIAGAALAGLMFASSAFAYTHTVTLKMGDSSSQVMSLQQALNGDGFIVASVGAGSPGMETTYFGQLTKNAVMSFQKAKGLSMIDGVVGNQTGTAIAALTGGSVTHPAGCSSASGYSTTTGQSCSNSLYPAGCTSATGYSTTTGASCAGTAASFPAGCSSAAGYSSSTGTKCDSSSSSSSSSTGPLAGGAGSI